MAEAFKSGPEAVAALGAANGCDFSVSDIQTAATSADLTDFELGLVSGGDSNADRLHKNAIDPFR